MRGLKLGNSLLLISAYLGRAGTQALLLWAFAQASGATGAGELTLAFAVATPIFIGFELGLRNVLPTLDNAPGFRVFFTLRLAGALVASLVVAACVGVGFVDVSATLLAPLIAMKLSDSVLDICLARLLSLSRHRRAAGVMWINTLVTVVIVVAVMASDIRPEWAVVGSAFASATVLVVVASSLLRLPSEQWIPGRDELARVLRSGLALGVGQTLMSVLAYLPVFFLAHGTDRATVGIFAVCQYSVTFASLFYNSAAQSWVADLRRAFLKAGRGGFLLLGRSVALFMLGAGAVGGLATLLVLPALVPLAFGADFQVDLAVAVPFGLAVLLLGLENTLSVMLVVLNRYVSRAATAVTAVCVTAALGLATVPYASVGLAGYLVLCGVATRCVVSGWNLHSSLRGLAVQETRTPSP